ncbi:MAG TPA: diguanylate cyclase [Terriglobales bacterium]|jgi:diguanylate cyclase (GGDEF)-like protein|nr:diguanylate cyclase [Terriglobales bacterium]
MNNAATGMVLIPGVVALLVCLLFSYLYEQSRQSYFRAWQLAWAAYTAHYALEAIGHFRGSSPGLFFLSSLLLVVMALCIFISTRLIRGPFQLKWYDAALALTGVALASLNLRAHMLGGLLSEKGEPVLYSRLEIGLATVLLYCSFRFYHYAHRKNSLAFWLLAVSLAIWAALMAVGQVRYPYLETFGLSVDFLGPIPQMLLAVAMVMVLAENQRNAVQENALAFSTLGIDPRMLFAAKDLVPSMQGFLDRLVAPLPTHDAAVYISEPWRATLPPVQKGFSAEFLEKLQKSGAGDYLAELAYRRGGVVTFHRLAELEEPLPALPGGRFGAFKDVMLSEGIRDLMAVSLQTREHNFGVILFPHAERRMFGSSNLRLLIGLSLQIALTLENYVVMHDAQRRTKEFELLTEIGQAISSHLNQDEVLRTVHLELGQIFDTSGFYIAFQEDDEIRFELEVEGGQVLPKRSRPVSNGLSEYIIRTGQPLLIQSSLEDVRGHLGVDFIPPRPAKSFCAVPILLGGKPAGVMGALSVDREYVFEARDLEVMKTAAGQLGVAVENARLFTEEQRRARHLAFLNTISKTAISSQDAEQMMGDIVREIQKNFRYDHIGIGIMDYATKDIEIKAEAGTTSQALGRRIAVGVGILGRVARTGASALVQNAGLGQLSGVLPESRAVLCLPITYGKTLLGVLNVESRNENAFAPQDVLILNTLADLLATALHNSFVFQKLQQQSITDGLTGIKTRRFFWEALSSEWKRASRSGRPFSVVLIDLDKFKEVNDGLGHLEGDLVLARVGRLLEQKCRQSNVVARYGGDEFIILMPETSIEQSQALAERLRLWLATDPMLEEHQITGSFGVASFPVHGFSPEDIIRVADAGMYISKHAGGNQVRSAELLSDGEGSGAQRQLVSGYIEGFLQRENSGPDDMEELVSTLRKLCAGREELDRLTLKEGIESLARASEVREPHAAGHGEQTGHYAGIIARGLNLSPQEVQDITFAARVHDVGKLFISEHILNKPGPLTDDEYDVMKTHASVGAEVLRAIPDSAAVEHAVEFHHEAFDGSGYPAGLKGENIPLWARIIAVSDAYVNMTCDRAFAPAKSHHQAMVELEKLSGTRFDGMIVRLFASQMKMEKTPSFGG